MVNMESDSETLEMSLHGKLENYLYPQMRLWLFQWEVDKIIRAQDVGKDYVFVLWTTVGLHQDMENQLSWEKYIFTSFDPHPCGCPLLFFLLKPANLVNWRILMSLWIKQN